MRETDIGPDFKSSARELLRAVRGRRSQVAFARRLGYRGNPVADWEAGRRAPSAAEALRACRIAGIDTARAFGAFHTAPIAAPEDPAELAAWLGRIRGTITVAELARRSGCSRHQIARWMSAEARPRLPEFLLLVEALTGRVSDLVAALVPIAQVPSLAPAHARREAARRLAYDEPWTEAILRVIETAEYAAMPDHVPGFVAAYLGIERETEERCLDKLRRTGVVEFDGRRYRAVGSLTVDTRAVLALKAHWARTALARLSDPRAEDIFSYNVFSASEADLERIAALLRATYREIRAIISTTPADEGVALINLQLMRWPRS